MHLCGVNSQIEDLSVPWVQLVVAGVEEEAGEWLHIIHMHTRRQNNIRDQSTEHSICRAG